MGGYGLPGRIVWVDNGLPDRILWVDNGLPVRLRWAVVLPPTWLTPKDMVNKDRQLTTRTVCLTATWMEA